ncbi:hypothetical protein [Chryseobacterium potabilaquae]|uniref:YD repeat-containing protein n=1 Tax=Chryseobacterium potabilaquae TaxID=2675057 RepID=A0A6N4X8F5_9FLAO|nr:hypothetical protein [Chryseobacterium potabilaquae]CAA7195243.1 hypothetical protein CHRY9293_01472 [Chryseobacterium potabilaquae]
MSKKIISFILFSTTIFIFGQGGGPSGPQITGTDPSVLSNILPPSAEAYKLGSYGNIPVSLFTGTANINIPLTEYKTKSLSLPLSLSYASNGIKIDDMNGSTGLGWSLITGGIITRTIRDLPDEDNTNISFPANIDSLGVRHPIVMQYLQDASNDLVDSEQDMYMANFNGNNFRFVFDRRGMPIIYSQRDIIIEGQSGGDSFTITMEDGIKYYFADKEITTNRTAGEGHSIPSMSTTAWYLTKILNPSTGEEIIIENQNAGYSTILSNSQVMKYTSGPPQKSECGNIDFYIPPIMGGLIGHLQSVNGRQIKKIYSNNPTFGEIIFEYTSYIGSEDYQKLTKVVKKINTILLNEINFDYILTANKRLFLSSVNDKISKAVHSFEYINPEELPVRLSFARDSGGYYNGALNNSSLIPKLPSESFVYTGASQEVSPLKSQVGMLAKITYPTKGNSMFFYENHTSVKNKIIFPGESKGFSIGAQSVDIDFGSPQQTKSETINSIRDEEIKLGGSASFNSTKCDPNLNVQGKHRALVTLKRPNGTLIPFYTKSPNGVEVVVGTTFMLPVNGNVFYAKISKDEMLKLTISTAFECTRSSVATSYTVAEPIYGNVQVDIAGLRINKIIDNSENGIATTRKFIYKDLNDQFSNAVVTREPIFTQGLYKTKTCVRNPPAGSTTTGPIAYGLERFIYNVLTSSNINQLNALHPNVFYKTVQEIVEGKSTIVHNYSIDTDYFGKMIYGGDIKSAPWTNFGWNNGREILTKYLDSNNNLIKTVEMNYEEDKKRKIQIDGLAIRKNYEDPVVHDVVQRCKAEDLNSTLDVTYCITKHSHTYSTTDWYKNCHSFGAQNITQTHKGICFGKNVGDVVIIDDRLDNLDVVQYKNISHFDYLKSQKITEYLEGVAMKTETEYFYNNFFHHQLTNKKTITPDLVINESGYKYAHEKGNQLMMNRNMIGIPLETTYTQTNGNATINLDKTETVYPLSLPTSQTGNLVLPLSIKSYDKLNSNLFLDAITYDRYDDTGNIIQYTAKDGNPVSIIFGYNKTFPIAKIEGMNYDQLVSTGAISSIIAVSNENVSDPMKESFLLNALNNFRTQSLLVGKKITTYTYNPLIGVTSITPTSGVRENYIYDSANRLEKVVDVNGKVLKEYKYNYKN